ncbi:MAG: hypothetical protein A2X28_11095 [Elusimicrobia bacterium GWA2_56_46]|jgi:uncharacterized membrane protein (DUF485 family)|nr:MAG: hypothetical protein A2X28_11095 [Elusimicrobia bacterium GWA2_56_46]OGR54145.1 MAG: hypothetical protein A2X39_05470 [Elusimicrobia bacterium GWC2_56_31]
MLHEPAAQCGPDASADYKMRIGVWMFLLYAAVYAVFVAINLLKPLWMERTVCFGLNLAVVYGFGLIAFALFLALIYNHMCGTHEAGSKTAEGAK